MKAADAIEQIRSRLDLAIARGYIDAPSSYVLGALCSLLGWSLDESAALFQVVSDAEDKLDNLEKREN